MATKKKTKKSAKKLAVAVKAVSKGSTARAVGRPPLKSIRAVSRPGRSIQVERTSAVAPPSISLRSRGRVHRSGISGRIFLSKIKNR